MTPLPFPALLITGFNHRQKFMEIKDIDKIAELLSRKIQGIITEEEEKKLNFWKGISSRNQSIYHKLCEKNFYPDKAKDEEKCDAAKAYLRFTKKQKQIARGQLIRFISRIAAILIIPLGIILTANIFRNAAKTDSDMNAIQPGKFNAVLTLSDGRKFILNEHSGDIPLVNKSILINKSGKQLEYQQSDNTHSGRKANPISAGTHKLEIPRNGEYKLLLPDGTKVYLNSSTTFRYPEFFSGKERHVQLTGEAYFEVKKDTAHPFIVETENLNISVYGTTFNVNTNGLNTVRTVLVDGAIGIRSHKKGAGEYVLKPSEMAEYDKSGNFIAVSKVNTMLFTSWKDGFFTFDNENLEEIMNVLSLWYDVEVFFTNQDIKRLHFTGRIEKYKNITTLLDIICDIVGLQYNINKRVITLGH